MKIPRVEAVQTMCAQLISDGFSLENAVNAIYGVYGLKTSDICQKDYAEVLRGLNSWMKTREDTACICLYNNQ